MNEKYNIQVGTRIKNARKEKRMSMKELGLKVNLHESTVSRYEKGDIKALDVDKLIEFADALDIPAPYLLGWINEEEKPKPKNEVNVGGQLKQLRESKNKTLLEVANEIFISVDDLKKYESGLTVIPIEVLEKVAIYFNVDINDLTTVKFPTSDRTALVTKDIELAKRQEKWFRELGFSNFTDEELDELISYAKYIKSKRTTKE